MNTRNDRRRFLQQVAGAAGASLLLARSDAWGQSAAGARPAAPDPMAGMSAPTKGAPVDTTSTGGMAGMAAPLPAGAPPEGSPLYKRVPLDLRVVQHELVPGVVVHMMAYNGSVPAPTFRVNEGDWVWVEFTNDSDEMHTIHWHGLIVPYRMDGVPYLTQEPAMRGMGYRYVFQAKPYGTHFYHCHFGTSMHMQAGMYGAFIVERPDDPIRKRYPYTQEYVQILSSIDTAFVREQMNGMFSRMRQRDVLDRRGALDLRTQSRFRSVKALRASIASGWTPPYSLSRTSPRPPAPNFFTVNGKSFPATEPIRVREGEWTRIRLINAGNVDFNMHLHGHDFIVVCDDGAPLDSPVRMNTARISPGKTLDLVFLADNPGYWAFHDHDVTHNTNNGIYPGGAMTDVEYEGFRGSYQPGVSLDE